MASCHFLNIEMPLYAKGPARCSNKSALWRSHPGGRRGRPAKAQATEEANNKARREAEREEQIEPYRKVKKGDVLNFAYRCFMRD